MDADGVYRTVLEGLLANVLFIPRHRLAADKTLMPGLGKMFGGDLMAKFAMDAGPVDEVAPGHVAFEFVVDVGHEAANFVPVAQKINQNS